MSKTGARALKICCSTVAVNAIKKLAKNKDLNMSLYSFPSKECRYITLYSYNNMHHCGYLYNDSDFYVKVTVLEFIKALLATPDKVCLKVVSSN